MVPPLPVKADEPPESILFTWECISDTTPELFKKNYLWYSPLTANLYAYLTIWGWHGHSGTKLYTNYTSCIFQSIVEFIQRETQEFPDQKHKKK